MHTVGRTYARDEGVTLASLMDYLPQDNDPGCSAGFAHGLVTGVAPDIDPSAPREAAAACADAGTRYQRYSCVHGFGHAFMRLYDDQLEPALELCTALGPDTAPDCAQGAYHDYWFAVVGADDARLARGAEKDPWRLCGSQPDEYVRPCWYRALLENRPEGFTVETAADLEGLCDGLEGLQRQGCITAASVIGPPDPAQQLQLCATLADPADAASCVRGTKAQNLLDAPAAEHVRLIDRLRALRAARTGRVLPLAGEDPGGPHRRPLPARGLPGGRGARGAPAVRGGRADDGGRARHLQLNGMIVGMPTLMRGRRAVSVAEGARAAVTQAGARRYAQVATRRGSRRSRSRRLKADREADGKSGEDRAQENRVQRRPRGADRACFSGPRAAPRSGAGRHARSKSLAVVGADPITGIAAGAGDLDLAEGLVATIAADRAEQPMRHVLHLELLAAVRRRDPDRQALRPALDASGVAAAGRVVLEVDSHVALGQLQDLLAGNRNAAVRGRGRAGSRRACTRRRRCRPRPAGPSPNVNGPVQKETEAYQGSPEVSSLVVRPGFMRWPPRSWRASRARRRRTRRMRPGRRPWRCPSSC